MFWRFVAPKYAFKDFKSHMNMQNHQTLKGLIRRLARKYPKAYRAVQQTLLFSTVYALAMTLIPGSELPFQKPIKVWLLATTCFFSKLWFYNMFTPSAGDYLIKVNEMALSGMKSQIFSIDFLQGYLDQIERVVQKQKKTLKTSNYLDLLLYSQLMLQSIVRFENRLLLQPSFQSYYFWIYQTVFPELANAKLSPKHEKHIKMFYTVLEYILNFGNQYQTDRCILIYRQSISTVAGHSQQHFSYVIAKRAFSETKFLELLKKKYAQTSSQEIKQQVVAIFEKLDDLYNHTE